MNIVKLSANGQITIPIDIRRQLGLRPGDRVLFYRTRDGAIQIRNAEADSQRRKRAAMASSLIR